MSVLWWKAAGIRAVKTFAQCAVATISAQAAIGVEGVSWLAVGSASLLAAILSLLTSLAGLPEVEMAKENITHELYISDTAPVEIEHGPEDKQDG